MNRDLYLALLALDAYNRGKNAQLMYDKETVLAGSVGLDSGGTPRVEMLDGLLQRAADAGRTAAGAA